MGEEGLSLGGLSAIGDRRARVLSWGARLVLSAILLAPWSCTTGRQTSGRTVTLEGEIVDPQCWFTHGARGVEHRSCAAYCARGGQDLAFMNRGDQKVYPLIAARHGLDPNDTLIAYAGYPVMVQGAFFGAGQQRVLRVDGIRRVDGLPPDALPPDTARFDPMPHLQPPAASP
jgi:hypothetical protein